MAALEEVGPGGRYLGTNHTCAHFQSAFYMPELLDNNSFEQWQAEGALDANARGLAKARELLGRWEDDPPALDEGVDEALRAFIAEREAVLPEGVG